MNSHTRELPIDAEMFAAGAGTSATDLLIEVDFKWLMAGQGCWIDPTRLRKDPLYAHTCLQTAMDSPCDALRRCAHGLQKALGFCTYVPAIGAAPA